MFNLPALTIIGSLDSPPFYRFYSTVAISYLSSSLLARDSIPLANLLVYNGEREQPVRHGELQTAGRRAATSTAPQYTVHCKESPISHYNHSLLNLGGGSFLAGLVFLYRIFPRLDEKQSSKASHLDSSVRGHSRHRQGLSRRDGHSPASN
jgi:hypothetical protein